MPRVAAAALAFALAAGAVFAMQFGPTCRSSHECGKSQECVAHEDRIRDVVRRTCEYPCSMDAAAQPCPKDRVCMQLAGGPQTSLGGVCVRVR